MKLRTTVLSIIALVSPLGMQVPIFAQVEPTAGTWKTWVISPADYRLAPPPADDETRGELEVVRSALALNNAMVSGQVKYWGAGSPAYRWVDYLSTRFLQGRPMTPFPHRVFTYVTMAMHDATVAAWDTKYIYNRPRPAQLDPSLRPVFATPDSPGYPSEQAVTAGAAATVLAYFFPAEADSLQAFAEEAARSAVYAGIQFPSDSDAGLMLGRQIGAAIVERARADGSDAVWTGTVPTGPCMWKGTNPGNVTATQWHPILLSSPDEFRAPPPPACDSPEVVAQLDAVKAFPRSMTAFATNERAFYWQSPEGIQLWPYRYANQWMFEDNWGANPPRAARAYSLIAAAMYDAFIASQDSKFTYWYIRPPQADSTIAPLFPVPNFPSYPSNHAVFSATRAEILAYLFPEHADFARALAAQASESRIWAGIHYRMDADAGAALGTAVAQKFIDWANSGPTQPQSAAMRKPRKE
jgi:membrane-associated phospholipid phosphatase